MKQTLTHYILTYNYKADPNDLQVRKSLDLEYLQRFANSRKDELFHYTIDKITTTYEEVERMEKE